MADGIAENLTAQHTSKAYTSNYPKYANGSTWFPWLLSSWAKGAGVTAIRELHQCLIS